MATGFQRVEALDRLRAVIDDVNSDRDVTVLVGPPRDPQQEKLVVIGDVSGQLQVPHLTAGRKHYDDEFSVEVLCIAWDAGAPDFAVADERCQQLAELVRDAVADRPRLEARVGADGLDGVVHAVVGRVDGPNRWWNPEGVGSAMRVNVDILVRIT
jgi:hypothetical protein